MVGGGVHFSFRAHIAHSKYWLYNAISLTLKKKPEGFIRARVSQNRWISVTSVIVLRGNS